jgi:hypothetical protein
VSLYKDGDGKAVPSTAKNHSFGVATPGVNPKAEPQKSFQTVGRQANLMADGKEGRSDRTIRLAAIKRRRAGGAAD